VGQVNDGVVDHRVGAGGLSEACVDDRAPLFVETDLSLNKPTTPELLFIIIIIIIIHTYILHLQAAEDMLSGLSWTISFGDWCFAAAGPRLWNMLPIHLRLCDSLGQFKRLLQTHLFRVCDRGALCRFS